MTAPPPRAHPWLFVALMGCASAAAPLTSPPTARLPSDWSWANQEAAPAPIVTEAQIEARCHAETARTFAPLGDAPTLPEAVHAALAEAEPFVVAGLESPRWQQFEQRMRYNPRRDHPILDASRAAVVAYTDLCFDLLHRDRDLAAGHAARDALRRCLDAGATCHTCVTDTPPDLSFATMTEGWLRSLHRIEASPPLAGNYRLPFMRAWLLPYPDALAALDALAAPDAPPDQARSALLLAARAALGRGDIDAAVTRLRRFRERAHEDAPDASFDRLAAVCRLLGRDLAPAAPLAPPSPRRVRSTR